MQQNTRSHCLSGSRVRQVFEAARDGNAVELWNVLKRMKSHEKTAALEAKTTSTSTLFEANEATPLIAAAENGHLDCVKILLRYKANITSRGRISFWNGTQTGSKLLRWYGSRSTTPLAVAAVNGHVDVLRCLVENRADVNARMDSNLTALMIASKNGHINVVKYLIEHGANIEFQDEDGSRALHYAVCHKSDSCDVLKCLLEKGAEVNAQTHLNRTPLMLASQNDHVNLVTCLLENGANVHLQDADGHTALHYAVSSSVHRDSCCVMRCLLKNGADVNASVNGLYTPLMLACRAKRINLLTFLIEHGADIDFQDTEGNTALHYAVNCKTRGGNVVNNMTEVAHKLLALGASQLYNNQRFTPLLLACDQCEISVVEDLIKRPECTKEQRIDALEFLGASLAATSQVSPFDEDYIPENGFEYMKRAMIERFEDPSNPLLKQIMEPEEFYQNQKESETLEELARIEGNTDALIMEGLIIRERILGTASKALLLYVQYVARSYHSEARGDFYLPICIGLYSRAIKIAQSCNESATFDLNQLTSLLYKNLKVATQNIVGELLEQAIFEYEKEQKSTMRSTNLSVLLDSLMKLVQIAKLKYLKYCEEGKTSRVSVLLQKLFHLNPRDDCGETLIHKAVEYVKPHTVKFLLNAGLNVNAINNNGGHSSSQSCNF